MKQNSLEAALGLELRPEFPIFSNPAPRPLSYLDTAASSQKPSRVIDRLSHYLAHEHANIHRGAYGLSARATENYDIAKRKIAAFIGAPFEHCIVFTKGTTESVNLVAYAFEDHFKEGDTILLTLLEHHSNIVPWQLLSQRKKLNLVFTQITDDGALDLKDLKQKLTKHRPKLLATTHIANSLGTLVPLEEVLGEAKKVNCKVFLDAAQSAAHTRINVKSLDLDFMAFSGHKFYGPTGIGVLYAKEELLQQMKPFQAGGDMIRTVTTEGSTFAEFAQKFEAGTPAIAEAIAFGEAVDFLEELGVENIQKHEDNLFKQAFELLRKEAGVTLYGPALKGGAQASIISFNVDKIHPHDLSTVADEFNVQFRSGHHCAMPTLKRLGIPSSARISLGVYSDAQDFAALLEAIRHARKMFA